VRVFEARLVVREYLAARPTPQDMGSRRLRRHGRKSPFGVVATTAAGGQRRLGRSSPTSEDKAWSTVDFPRPDVDGFGVGRCCGHGGSSWRGKGEYPPHGVKVRPGDFLGAASGRRVVERRSVNSPARSTQTSTASHRRGWIASIIRVRPPLGCSTRWRPTRERS